MSTFALITNYREKIIKKLKKVNVGNLKIFQEKFIILNNIDCKI